MIFGHQIGTDDPFGTDPSLRADRHLERAICARDSGFGLITAGARYSYGPADADEGGSLQSSRFQPLPLLAFLAGHLRDTVDYATTVLVSAGLHPVQLAEDVATLDGLCAGRFRVGLGIGWMPYELAAFGVPRAQRASRFEELVTVLRQLLTLDSVTFAGRHFAMENVNLAARDPRRCPPIWIGASVDAAVRRAARLGDAWSMSSHSPLRELTRQLAVYSEELDRCARPRPRERPVNRHIILAEDRKSALAEAAPILEAWYRKRGDVGWFQDERTIRSALETGDIHWIVGNPADCVEQIALVRDKLDANMVNLSMSHNTDHRIHLDTLRLFGEQVIPHFR